MEISFGPTESKQSIIPLHSEVNDMRLFLLIDPLIWNSNNGVIFSPLGPSLRYISSFIEFCWLLDSLRLFVSLIFKGEEVLDIIMLIASLDLVDWLFYLGMYAKGSPALLAASTIFLCLSLRMSDLTEAAGSEKVWSLLMINSF